jgi:hypothetical protein
LGGEYKRDKDKSFETEEHGMISHDKVRRICTDKFGAESKRRDGFRYLEFNLAKLEKAKAAYIFPDKVVILQKNVSESGHDENDRDDEVLEGTEVNEKSPEDENSQEIANNATKESENIQEIEEMGGNGHAKDNEKSDVYPKTLSYASSLSLKNSDVTIQKYDEETLPEIIHNCMLDEKGNNQGYFTIDRWKTRLMLLPRQHPLHGDEDQAEQTLYALVEEGRVTEFEPRRFKPVE